MTNLLEEAPTKARMFTLFDRCDRCQSAAQQSWTREGKEELLFCNHHGNKNSLVLSALGWSAEFSGEVLCRCQMCVPVSEGTDADAPVINNEGGNEGPVPA